MKLSMPSRARFCLQVCTGPALKIKVFLSGNLDVIDALVDGLQDAGLNPLPLYIASLKDPVSQETVTEILNAAYDAEILPMGCVLNTTGFAASSPGATRAATPWEAYEAVIELSTTSRICSPSSAIDSRIVCSTHFHSYRASGTSARNLALFML